MKEVLTTMSRARATTPSGRSESPDGPCRGNAAQAGLRLQAGCGRRSSRPKRRNLARSSMGDRGLPEAGIAGRHEGGIT